tara:strand:+ start:13495 stop:19752 length:6258 start_codon:yes stop_codon:yes gene_type:complete
MANSDKDILITPNTGQSANPKIEVTGADNATKTITINDDGTLSFDSTIAATTGSVADGNANLVTGDAVFDYIAAQNFASSGASNFVIGDITGQTALTSGLDSTDELVLSDAGTLKRMDVSVLQSYMQSNLTFTTDTILTTENVQDIIGAMVDGGTETNIAVTYDDTGGKLNFVSTDTNTQLTQEQVEDFVAGVIVAGSNITKTYDDAAGTLTLAATDTNTQLTTEEVQDIVGAMFTSNTETRVSATYEDGDGTIDLVVDDMTADTNTQLSTEQVQDIVGAMLVGTETRIGVTYDDTNGRINFVVDDMTANTQLTLLDEDNFATNSATAAASQQSIKAYVDSEVAGLVDSSPSALNTLNELAAALGDDASFSTTTATSLGNRLRVDVSNQGLTSTQQGNALTNLGITASLAEINILDDGLAASDIPNLASSKITSGTLGTARIPSLAASKITSGTFATARIADDAITAAKISTTNTANSSTDNYLLSYDDTSGGFTLVAAGAGGENNQNAFSNVAVSGQTTAAADSTTDTLTLVAAGGMTITTSGDSITLNSANTNTQLTTEQVQDIVGGMFGSNTETRISATYQDGDGTIDLVVDDMTANDNTQLSTEQVQDIVGAMFGSNTETRISATYQDGDGTIDLVVDDMTANTNTNQLTTFTLTGDSGTNQTIAHGNTLDIAGGTGIDTVVGNTDTVTVAIDNTVATLSGSQTLSNKTIAISQVTELSNLTADEGAQLENIGSTTISAAQWGYLGAASGAITNTDTQLSTEQVQDIVGAMFSSNTETRVSATYQDGDGTIDLVVDDMTANTNTQLSTEQVQDIVGGMLVGTETRIGVSYDDTNGRINFVVDDMTANTQLTLLDQDNMSSNSATAAASQQSIKAYVDAEVAGIVASAPSALNTLNELAAALGDDASFSTTTATSLGNRLRVDVSNQGLTSTQQGNALTNLGITASLAEINILDGGLSASNIPTITASKVTEISNLTAAEGAQLENIGSTTISAAQWGYLGAATGAITNTNTQLSDAEVVAALNSDLGGDIVFGTQTDDNVKYTGSISVGNVNQAGSALLTADGFATMNGLFLGYGSGPGYIKTYNGSDNLELYAHSGSAHVKMLDLDAVNNKVIVGSDLEVGVTGTAGKVYLSVDDATSFLGWNSTGTDVTLAASDDLTLHADDDIFFQAGGTTKMYLLNDGKLGIGTSTPAKELDVAGDIQLSGSLFINDSTDLATLAPTFVQVYNTNGSSNATVKMWAETWGGKIGTTSSDDFFIVSANSDRMQFDGSMRTTFYGSASADPIIRLSTGDTTVSDTDDLGVIEWAAGSEGDGTDGDARLVAASVSAVAEANFTDTANTAALVFKTATSEAATEKMRLTNVGRLGIGTTTPRALLDVTATNNPTILLNARDSDYAADDKIGSLLFYNNEDSSGQTGSRIGAGVRFVATDAYGRGRLELSAGTSSPMSSYNAAEDYTDNSIARLSILTDGGNIGIGTTSPAFPLDVNGFISTSTGIVHTGDTNNTITFGTDTQSFNTGSTARMNISDSGLQVGTGARVTTINTSFSDNDTSLMTSQAIKEKIEAYGYTTDTNTNLTTEQVQDIVGAMFSSNTETNITATYQDADGTIDLVASAGGSGDITAVVAGTGLTGGASSGSATLNVIGGTGITANANDMAVTAAQTGITSILNSSLKVGYGASDAYIDFATDNNMSFAIDNTVQFIIQDTIIRPGGNGVVALGQDGKRWSEGHFNDLLVAGNSVLAAIDEDNMASNSASRVPTQQSVKAYVDANAGGGSSAESDGSKPVVYMDSGNTDVDLTERTIPFDTEVLDPSGNASKGADGHIRIVDAGYYEVSYSLPINDDGSTGADRTRIFAFAQTASNDSFSSNLTTITQSRSQVYTREASGGSGLSASFIYQHTANDYIRIRIDAQQNTNISTEVNQSQISIRKLSTPADREFVINAAEGDFYVTSTAGAGNANGFFLGYGDAEQNTTRSSSGSDIGFPIPKDCELVSIHLSFGNNGSETNSSNQTITVFKNRSASTTTFTYNASGSGGNQFSKEFTSFSGNGTTYSAGDTFNLRATGLSGYTDTQVGPVRAAITFRET